MTFTKDPDAVLDYSVDWTLWLAGDEIPPASGCWRRAPREGRRQRPPTKTTVWLRGGQAGTTYPVTNRIVTVGGRTDDRTISVKVAGPVSNG